jgi:hypothetical protein
VEKKFAENADFSDIALQGRKADADLQDQVTKR